MAAVFLTGVLILPDVKQHALDTGPVGVTFALARLKSTRYVRSVLGTRDEGMGSEERTISIIVAYGRPSLETFIFGHVRRSA